MRNTLLALLAAGVLIPSLTAQPPRPAPPPVEKQDRPARAAYELRMLQVGDTSPGIRFKSATGEAWTGQPRNFVVE